MQKKSLLNTEGNSPLSQSYKWYFYNITWSDSCPSPCTDPHYLMWGKTLPQVIELEEACTIRDALKAAVNKDEEIKNKQP